jgi:hypothetical protein
MNDHQSTLTNCENFGVDPGKICHPEVAKLKPRSFSLPNASKHIADVKLSDRTIERADEICGQCPFFLDR